MALAKEEQINIKSGLRRRKRRTAKKTVRKEMVPDWLKEEEPKEQEKETAKKDVSVEKDASTLEDERKRLEEVLKNISVINRRE